MPKEHSKVSSPWSTVEIGFTGGINMPVSPDGIGFFVRIAEKLFGKVPWPVIGKHGPAKKLLL